MKLYLSKGRIWTGTQADAKAAQGGNDYEHVEVPDPKPERIAWLNQHWNDRPAAEDRPQDAAPPVEAHPEPKPSPAPVRAPVGDLSEQIMELEGPALLNVLEAAIGRLHETAGHRGWATFAKHTKAWGDSGVATDRGMGMLVLAGLAAFAKEEG